MRGKEKRRLKKPLCRALMGLLLLSGSPSVCAERISGDLVLTMDESVRLALDHNPNIIKARQEQEKAQAQITEARADALPALNLNVGYTRTWIQQASTITIAGEDENGDPFTQTQTVTFGTPNLFNADLSLNQVLYAGGKVRHALKAAKIYARQVQTNTQTAALNVRFGVRRSFLGVLLSREAVTVAQKALAQSQAHLAQVESQYKEGTAAEFDLLRAQVETANLEPPLIEAQNAYRLAREWLKNAIGLDMAQNITVQGDLQTLVDQMTERLMPRFSKSDTTATPPENAPIDPDLAAAYAYRHRPELEALDIQSRLLEEQKAIARGTRHPSLSLVGAYGLQWQLPDEWRARSEDIQDNWTTGLALTMPLFEGGRTRARMQQIDAAMKQIEAERKKRSDQVFLDVKSALLNLQEARQKIAAQKQTVAQAERGLSIADVRFASGMSTQVEVLSSQLALTVSRTQYIQALHDCAMALAELERATGFSDAQPEL